MLGERARPMIASVLNRRHLEPRAGRRAPGLEPAVMPRIAACVSGDHPPARNPTLQVYRRKHDQKEYEDDKGAETRQQKDRPDRGSGRFQRHLQLTHDVLIPRHDAPLKRSFVCASI
jgi:hypothetical protein